MDSSQVFTLIGLSISFLTLLGGVMKFLLRHIGEVRKEANDSLADYKKSNDATIVDLYKNMNHIKDTSARREDLIAHSNRIENGIADINKRLDGFFGMIVNNFNNKNKE